MALWGRNKHTGFVSATPRGHHSQGSPLPRSTTPRGRLWEWRPVTEQWHCILKYFVKYGNISEIFQHPEIPYFIHLFTGVRGKHPHYETARLDTFNMGPSNSINSASAFNRHMWKSNLPIMGKVDVSVATPMVF